MIKYIVFMIGSNEHKMWYPQYLETIQFISENWTIYLNLNLIW